MIELFRQYYKHDGLKNFSYIILVLIIITHYISGLLQSIGFFLVLMQFYRSKQNYIWFAVIFATIDFPGALVNTSSMIILPSLREYAFHEAFVIVAFLKSFKYKANNYRIVNNIHFVMFAFLIVLFIYSLASGASFFKFFRALRYSALWLLLLSMPKLISKDDFVRMFRLVFALLPIALIIQIVGFILGNSLGNILFGIDVHFVNTESESLRIVWGITVAMFGLLGSLIYYDDSRFSRKYLTINIVLSLLFILSTATRGWTIGAIGALIFYFYFSNNGRKMIMRITSLVIIFSSVVFILPMSISHQFSMAFRRLLTLETLAKGDVTAGGTLSRLDEYAPIMNEAIIQQPLLGYGMMDAYTQYANGHLGYHNMILQSGFLGLGFFLLIFLMFFSKLFMRAKINANLKSPLIGVISIFIFMALVNSGAHYIGFFPATIDAFYIQSLLIVLGSSFYYSEMLGKKVVKYDITK